MERKKKTENKREKQAKTILIKVIKFIMKLQRPTEETISIALIPKPFGEDKKPKPYDYAFLIRTEETPDKDTLMLVEYLKAAIFPMLFELASDIVTIEETQVMYDTKEYTCFYVKFVDPEWRTKIERKVELL